MQPWSSRVSSMENTSGHDNTRWQLRATLTEIERELTQLEPAATSTLREAFAHLVVQLALGPEPEMRLCPVCGSACRRAATRCGYCWASLSD
jgi:hypothetical protein